MKRQQAPTFNQLCDALQSRPSPRSQAEWREASTAMRLARRHPGRVGRTIYIECGTFARRIYLEATWGGVNCYNGPHPFGYVNMIAHHRFVLRQGLREGRVAEARHFAEASRLRGPVPLP
ncbi:hypothetical protein [Bradyrhizobium sp. C9]|uniref:hypothetical protein n=1 Tax=Bradyrhizobium sp. C9 TaxID=142585 RepID=UPI000BEAE4C3|nr:hypothetical protein [Bradyrhizobium sp. C9]PDT77197.1 hypothetical protein CO675_11710 [Bradyrhizobium sp. C9]